MNVPHATINVANISPYGGIGPLGSVTHGVHLNTKMNMDAFAMFHKRATWGKSGERLACDKASFVNYNTFCILGLSPISNKKRANDMRGTLAKSGLRLACDKRCF